LRRPAQELIDNASIRLAETAPSSARALRGLQWDRLPRRQAIVEFMA